MIRSTNHILLITCIVCGSAVFHLQSASAQSTGSASQFVQVGVGVLPGVGVQIALVDQERMYTRDVVFHAHVQPGVFENSGNVQISGLVGVSVRIFGLLETVGAIDPRSFDLHLGARIGPGLTFAFEESALEKNQRFSLTLEPIVRLVKVINDRRFFAEVGIVRPSIRFGMQIDV